VLALRDRTAWLTLARPHGGNRLDADMMAALAEAAAAAEDAAADVVVLTARGRVFSEGLPARCTWPGAAWADGVAAIAAITKPVIAALPGDARGWGLSLALACDLRVAARNTLLGFAPAPTGALAGGGATQRLPRLVGTGRALQLVLLGTTLRAGEALTWGLVHAVVAAAAVERTAARMASRLAARGPVALRLGKEAVLRALDLPLADGIRMEEDLYVLLQTTADRAEGIRAFLERRPPRFAGR
jgi:enoyl-CoA hydratase/carnithine racemase